MPPTATAEGKSSLNGAQAIHLKVAAELRQRRTLSPSMSDREPATTVATTATIAAEKQQPPQTCWL